jgi:hypothetical protein
MCFNCNYSEGDLRVICVKTDERDVTEELVQRRMMKLIGLLTLRGSEYILM